MYSAWSNREGVRLGVKGILCPQLVCWPAVGTLGLVRVGTGFEAVCVRACIFH